MAQKLGLALALFYAFSSPPVFAEDQDPFPRPPRPVTLLPEAEVDALLARMPPIFDFWLAGIIQSRDTVWYDKKAIVPGYQDSFGDGREFPVGFRPNTLQPFHIDGAVPGGHARLFRRKGEFHFPLGRTGHPDDAMNTSVIDFWKLPRQGKKLQPVVWWRRRPTSFHNRVEWMFPIGTVFGEVIQIEASDGSQHVFEIRTRTRLADGWESDVFRPFVTSDELLSAVERKRRLSTRWSSSASASRLTDYLKNPLTLVSETLGPVALKLSFAPITGGVDYLPEADEALWKELLSENGFQSAKGRVWKQSGSLQTFAASTKSNFSIVPRNYNASHFEVSDNFCSRCHQDAGRPIKDYEFMIQLYGEMWGEDETFSWHPFDTKAFVDVATGNVVSFSNENRRFRQDFLNAGLLEEYNTSVHPQTQYKRIQRAWHNYVYR